MITNVNDLLNRIAAKVDAEFRRNGVKWTVKVSDMNRAVLAIEPGWPDNAHGTAGLVAISTKVGSTDNWLVRIHAFDRWVKATDRNLDDLVSKVVEYTRNFRN